MKHILRVMALLLIAICDAQQCNQTFLGELTDFHDGTPIPGATVYIINFDRYTTSDENGKFKINNVCNGILRLRISHVACETKTFKIDIKGDTFKALTLEHHIETLSEVSITGQKILKTTTTAQESLLKEEMLQQYSALQLGDALKEIAGVSSINTGNAIVKPMINGMHSSRLLILSNNVRLQDQEWGIEHAPNVDINAAGQISVIKGSGTLAYGGDAIGGVIIMKPKPLILTDTLYGQTIISGQTNGYGYSVNSRLNKSFDSGWYVNALGTFKKNGDFRAPDYYLTNTGNQSKAFTLQTGKRSFETGFEVYYSYLNNDIGILRSSHIGNIADLVDAINAQEPIITEDFSYDINSPRQDVTHHLLKASYFKRFRALGKLNLQYDYQNNQRFEFDIRVGDDRDKPALDLNLQTHTAMADLSIDANDDYELQVGVLGRYQNNFANPDTGVRRLIPDYDKYDFGAYITSEWQLDNHWLFDAGFRYEFTRIDAKKFYLESRWEERGYDETFGDIVIEDLGTQLLTNPVFNYNNFSASAGVRHSINSKSQWLFNYALATRAPNVSELFSDGLHHSAARIELGDLNLVSEVSHRFAATYQLTTSDLDLNIEGFYNRINNFIYLEPTGVEQTIRGAFPVWEYNQALANFYGFDFSFNYQINEALSVNNKTSYILANDLDNDRPIIDIPPLNIYNAINYQNDNWKPLKITLEHEWFFRQNRFPDNNFETYIASRDETVLVDISTPPPAYGLFNLKSDLKFNTSKRSHLTLALNVNNIFNTNYRSYLNRLRFFADDLGRNVMLQLQYNY